MALNNPSENPKHPWALFESRLLMSTGSPSTDAKGIRWKLSDLKSVEMHASGQWLIVTAEEGETWWLRVDDDVQTIEFNRFHEAHMKPDWVAADKPEAAQDPLG